MLEALAGALGKLGPGAGPWHVFVGASGPEAARAAAAPFAGLAHVRVLPFGPDYLDLLAAARVALVYGGYNSLTDVLAAGVPAVVLSRGMRDGEQEAHVSRLAAATAYPPPGRGRAHGAALADILAERLACRAAPPPINLDGAADTARLIARRIGL